MTRRKSAVVRWLRACRPSTSSPRFCQTRLVLESLENRTLLSLCSAAGSARNSFGILPGPKVSPVPAALEGKVEDSFWCFAQQVQNVRAVPDSGSVDRVAALNEGQNQARVNERGEVQSYIYVISLRSDLLQALGELGVTVEASSERMSAIQAWVPADRTEAVTQLSGVVRLGLPSYGITSEGWTTTAGDSILRADRVRSRFADYGIDGAGVKVGVISDGVDHAALLTGFPYYDLAAITINPNLVGDQDEGIGMLEIVHDLAPGAQLYFAGLGHGTGFTTLNMVNAIDWMVNQGVHVIVDDVAFFAEPYFQDGVVASAAAEAVNQGVVYITAAGNSADSHYQAPWIPMGLFDWDHDFSGSGDRNFYFQIRANTVFQGTLQWSDPWGDSSNDYDIFLYLADGTLLDAGTDAQNGNDNPTEFITFNNTSPFDLWAYITIHNYAGLFNQRELELFISGASVLEYVTPNDSIIAQGAVESVITVGAIAANDPGNDDVEVYSSRGNSTIYTSFADQDWIARESLDGVAIDGVHTTVGLLGYFNDPFYGTSAAAPHVAGIAALMLQANPGLTPAAVEGNLQGSAVDLYGPEYDRVSGWGRFDALDAVYQVFTPATPDLVAASDTGFSSTDNVTIDTTPTVTGTVPYGSYVQVFADGVQVGSQQLGTFDDTYNITTSTLSAGTKQVTITVASSFLAVSNQSRNSNALTVVIDTTAPIADVLDVAPDVRATPVSTMTITFDSAVVGFDLSDLALRRDGGANLLTAEQSLSTADNVTWTLNNLAHLTAADGTYTLTLTATGAGIADLAGNTLIANASDSFTIRVILTVTSAADSGAGTLRQALLDANAIAGLNPVRFSIGSGAQTINLASALPAITDAVVIDGTTQLGFAGTPLIALNGQNAGANADGLTVNTTASEVHGLVINRFGSSGVALQGGSGHIIAGNYIGTDLAGAADLGNTLHGIYIASSSTGSTIGGTTATARNVISGNNDTGIFLNGSTDNVIIGNYIGTNADGQGDLGNSNTGVYMSNGAANNRVGGSTAGERNIISGNDGDGVTIRDTGSTGNRVSGNFIGADVTGMADLGNSRRGVVVYSGASNNTIGGTAAGSGNVISGNDFEGIALFNSGTSSNWIQGNFIGTNAAGTAAVPNSFHGVWLESGPSNNTIGGTATGAGNVISGNLQSGVWLRNTGTSNNLVQGNYIGTDAAGTADLGNGTWGVLVSAGATNNTVGGITAEARNVISGNNDTGIGFADVGTTSNLAQGNYVGTDKNGTADLGNSNYGVFIGWASPATIPWKAAMAATRWQAARAMTPTSSRRQRLPRPTRSSSWPPRVLTCSTSEP